MWGSRTLAAAATGSGAAARDVWTIAPRREGLWVRLREFWRYRKILWFFTTRTVKRTYEGTLLGKIWLLRPILPIAIGAFVFGRLLGVPSDGIPYFLFFLTGSAAWMLFEQSAIWVTRSLDINKGIVTKVYIPRLVVPVSALAPALVYFGVFLVLLLMAFVQYLIKDDKWYLVLGLQTVFAVAAAVMCVVQALAIGLWTAVWQTRVREVRFTLRYVLRFWNYLTPVIYPLSLVPPEYRGWMVLNPMAAYVELFKWSVLGVGTFDATSIAVALSMTFALLWGGAWYFTREEGKAIDNL